MPITTLQPFTPAERYDHAIDRLRHALTPDQFQLVLDLDAIVGERLRTEHELADHVQVVDELRALVDRTDTGSILRTGTGYYTGE